MKIDWLDNDEKFICTTESDYLPDPGVHVSLYAGADQHTDSIVLRSWLRLTTSSTAIYAIQTGAVILVSNSSNVKK